MSRFFVPSKLMPILVLLALWWLSPVVRAQYRFDHWTADNGLPQNSVRDIVQTRDGYLWMTTFDGLVRFDGARFTVFNKGNTPGIPGNRFYTLIEDRRGDLWATLETGEVVRRHQGRFVGYNQAQGLPGIQNPCLMEDEAGNVLVYFYGWNFDRKGNSIGNVKQVYRWAGDRFEPAAELRYDFSRHPISAEELKVTVWGRVVAGDFWSVNGQNVIRYRKEGGVQTYHDRNGLPGKPLTLLWGRSVGLQAVTRDAGGRLWLTDLRSMQSRMVSDRTPDGFSPWLGYADAEGNYWFSISNNGLFRARRQTIVPLGKSDGLDVGEVYPMLEGRDGTLWIGSGNGVFGLRNGTLTRIGSARIDGIESFGGNVSSLYEDRTGRLWVNGYWRLVDGRFVPPPWADALSFQNKRFAWTMCEDGTGAYWIGSTNGVARVWNGNVTHFTSKDGLAANDTKVIIEDGRGGLWLGAYGGLTHFKDGRFTAWTEKDGLPGATVRALKVDDDGALWIGTYDSGLARFKDGRFTRYTTKDGLFDSGVFQILEDAEGWFWMSCNRGIYRVRKRQLLDFAEGKIKTVTCLAYNQGDGMPSTECNGGRWPAGVKARDGRLYFPTMAGVAMVDPAHITTSPQAPPIIIEEMRVNNQAVADEMWDAALHDPGFAIPIQPGQDNFEIAYTALSFINSENLRFRYKLEDADAEWIEAGTRRTAYFSHLAPGEYTFRVTAANAAGVWNENGASIRIAIVPPFWRTGWFFTLTAVGVAGAFAGAWRVRVAGLRRAQRVQQAFARRLIESQELERKRIAAELHDSLGQTLLIVKNRAQLGRLAAGESSESFEQFEAIVNAAAHSIEEVRTISQNLRPYHLDRLGLTKSLEVMVEQVAATTKLRFVAELIPLDDLFTKDQAITLYRVMQECLNNTLKHAAASEVRIGIERTTESVVVTVRDDGRGFSPAETAAAGLGLTGMAERVRMLGGMVRIDSSPGRGTTVTVRLGLPLTPTTEVP